MENENGEILDSSNEEPIQEESLETPSEDTQGTEYDDVDVLREKNRQLFARAKKAETELKAKKNQPEEKPPTVAQPTNEDLILRKVDERFEQRELDSLKLDSKLKKEVQAYAKLNKVSITEAFDSDYIQFKKDKAEKEAKSEEAALGNTKRAPSKKDYSQANPDDFDLRTKDGKEEFAKYEEHLRKALG